MKKLLLLLFAVSLFSCTDEDGAERILEENGYTDIEITGYKAFCCGEDDTFKTGFRATGPTGKPVSGCVCSGWGKGGTIRFD